MRALWSILCVLVMSCQRQTIQAYPTNFVGVGVELTESAEGPKVVATTENGPARLAGMQADDQIVAVDTHSTINQSLADVVSSLRGVAGSTVNVTVRRSGTDLTMQITRRHIQRGGEGYIVAPQVASSKP